MSEHFINRIEIKNFKCFEDFKAEGFGRVNLIGGKNNVGKTAFMEGCYLNSVSKNAISYLTALSNLTYMRDYANLNREKIKINMNLFFNRGNLNKFIEINSNTNINMFEVEQKSSIESIERYIINNNIEEFNTTSFKESPFKNLKINELFVGNNHFLSAYNISDNYFKYLLDRVKSLRKRDELHSAILTTFNKEFDEFDFLDNKPKLFNIKQNIWEPLSILGDGITRFITIICAIYSSKNGYLFIDEIENGIHYTKIDEVWKLILEISKEQNVQVFATTHSKECIESYARVAKRLEDKEITFIELGRNDNNEIESIIYPYEWLINEIKQNHEVRGW